MELIKEIESRRDKKGWLRKWAIFLCEHCKIYVEMRLDSGVKAKSCGCNKNIKHGDRKIRLYGVWTNIKTRCTNPNNKRYKDYGGRGIIIYDIISGEFKRIKSIPYTNFELALAFIKDKDLDITTQISEKELNDLIQEALKILYGIN